MSLSRQTSSHIGKQVRAGRAEITAPLIDSSLGPDSQLMAAERARLVRKAVGELAPRDRAVLTPFYPTDTSKEDICDRLALTPAQFDLIKWRALKRLFGALRSHERRDE